MRKADFSFYLPYRFRRIAYRYLAPDAFDRLSSLEIPSDKGGYSVRPYFESKCIFVHVPKTAGISVCHAIFGNNGGGHTTLGEYQIIFSSSEFDSFFKFAFVRNPWDRLHSAYRFLKKGGMNNKDKLIKERFFDESMGFRDFVLHLSGNAELMRYEHFRPQTEFLLLPHHDKMILNYIGLFEKIDDDFRHILGKLGRDSKDLLPRKNISQKIGDGGYMDAYDDETKKVVERLYKRDIELLGYTFENADLKGQIDKLRTLGFRQ